MIIFTMCVCLCLLEINWNFKSRILDNLQSIHFIHVLEVMKVTMSKKIWVRIFKNTDNVMNVIIVMVLKVVIKGMKIMIIGPLNPAIHGIRVASSIAFSVCVCVCSHWLGYKFSNSLQHNIRPPSRNSNACATKFAAGVNLRRHDTLRWTVMNVMTIFLWEWS